jgi:hypothetical protein
VTATEGRNLVSTAADQSANDTVNLELIAFAYARLLKRKAPFGRLNSLAGLYRSVTAQRDTEARAEAFLDGLRSEIQSNHRRGRK